MRRYAFEALIAHALWFLVLFVFTDGFTMPFHAWMDHWFQWDARWYGTIAQDGHGFLPQTYVFPPLHGWVLGRLADALQFVLHLFVEKPWWVHSFYLVTTAFGVLTFAFANTIFVILSERRWNIDRVRLWGIALANPMAYFAVTAYSDTFFSALLMLTLLLVTWTSPRREAWRLPELSRARRTQAHVSITALLFVLPWVRLTGFASGIWIFLRRKEVTATFASLFIFLLYYYLRTDDPLFFLFVQKAFQMPDGWIGKGFLNACEILYHMASGDIARDGNFILYWTNFGLLPLACLALSVTLVIWLWRRREFEWALIAAAIVLISHNQAFWRSTVRYTLPLFPLFFWMILVRPPPLTRPKRIAFALAIGVGLALQIFYARLFRSGGWAF